MSVQHSVATQQVKGILQDIKLHYQGCCDLQFCRVERSEDSLCGSSQRSVIHRKQVGNKLKRTIEHQRHLDEDSRPLDLNPVLPSEGQ
jgi:hypothetical protein